MPLYNLLEYSKNYSKTSGFLWNYYGDELIDDTTEDANNPNKNIINSKLQEVVLIIMLLKKLLMPIVIKSFKEVEIVVPLKYLRSFW